MSDVILEKRKKEKDPLFKRPPVLITVLVVSVIIIASLTFLIINSIEDKNSVNPNGKEKQQIKNFINDNVRNYLKELNKYAITEKRINSLLKDVVGKGDRYDNLVTLEISWLKVGWELLNKREKKDELLKKIEEYIKSLIPSLPKFEEGKLVKILYKIMIENDNIANYENNDNIVYINNKLKENKLEKEIISVFLYTFINLPMQMGYFSGDENKEKFLSEIKKQMEISPGKEIFKNINQNMPEPPSNPFYIVLGGGQGEEKERITAVESLVNVCNTGIRTQSSKIEVNNYLVDNIKHYYTNSKLRSLMEKSRVSGKFTDIEYSKFVEECNDLAENATIENAFLLFTKYNFSVETANTVIEYLKLDIPVDNINIIRLGENNEENKNYKYNKSQVYILFDIVDLEKTIYNSDGISITITRATTVANVKTLIYLKKECPNFLPEGNEIVLVSGKSYAERQLEAFNIIYGLLNYDLKIHYVIWNKNDDKELNKDELIDLMINFSVKGFNIAANTLKEIYAEKEDMKNINEFITNILKITDDAKEGKY